MPVGSNPWNYNELPQHLKDYLQQYPYTLSQNGQNFTNADAFNRTDRSGQDYLINLWDRNNLRFKTAEAKENERRQNEAALKAAGFSTQPKGAEFDYNALPASARYTYQSLPDWAKRYIAPNQQASFNVFSPDGKKVTDDVFDNSRRSVQEAWMRKAQDLYARDLASGKIKPPAQPKQQASQQSPQQSQPRVVSSKPPMTRMQSAISRAASSGRMGNNNLNLKMGQPIFNGQTGLMKNSGGSQLLNQMGFPSNQAGVPTQGARRPVPMPQGRKPNINAGLV